MSNQLDDALAGTGSKSAFTQDSPVGTKVSGPIVDATIRQATDYVTKQPKTWDNGDPQNQVVVRIQTDARLDEDDDGIRGIYIKTWGVQKTALLEAIRAAGGTKASDVLKPGATFTATFIGTEPSSQGSPAKLYKYEVNPNGAVDAALNSPAAQHVATDEDGQAKKIDTAKALISLGQGDAAIAEVTGLDTAVIAAIRNV